MKFLPTLDNTPMMPDDLHNHKLINHVRPHAWRNPTPSGRYNLVVIGAGTAGLVAAVGAASLGAKVALIEKHFLGGDCLNFGCVPSKGMIRAARAAADVREARLFGVRIEGMVRTDFAAAMERMRRLRASIARNDSVDRLQKLGIHVYFGRAHFVAPDAIAVGNAHLLFDRAIIATGARATGLPIPGLAEAGYHTNETVFSLTSLPHRLAVIGAGPVGCELAQTFARFGANVTIIEAASGILSREDRDAALVVQRALEHDGVKVMTDCKIVRVNLEPEQSEDKTIIVEQTGIQNEIKADEILVGIGRTPNIEDLGLEVAGIASDKRGIHVDDQLRTTNRHVYAAGDVCSVFKFTHAADAMARIALQNALFLGRKKVSALIIPNCTFTDPEIAHVGLYEHEAQQRGLDAKTLTLDLTDVDRAVLDGETDGFARIHYNPRNGRILGATLVARHAGDMIGELSLAITHGLSLHALANTIHPYPTQAEAWKRLGDAWNRLRLTPTRLSLLKRYFTLRFGSGRAVT